MMSLLERELEEFDKTSQWQVIYTRLRNEASLAHQFSVKVARKPENRNRNRYRDVSPYDHSRVIIQNTDNDYINASLVEAPLANRKYILTQGPLRNTSGHFWQMVWEQKTKAIVMLNRVIERETVKCDQYWPLGSVYNCEDELIFDDVGFKVTLLEENEASFYTVMTLELENLQTGAKREVLHFHYVMWPDFGVPSSPAAFLNFLLAVRKSGALESDVGPTIVHCSAGIGRSGTFCLVDTCLIMIEKNRDMSELDIRALLLDMRKYRMGLIQTHDQLRFSYLAVLEGGKKILQCPPGSPFEEFEHGPPPKPIHRYNPIYEDSSSGGDSDVEIVDVNTEESSSDDFDWNPAESRLAENRVLEDVDQVNLDLKPRDKDAIDNEVGDLDNLMVTAQNMLTEMDTKDTEKLPEELEPADINGDVSLRRRKKEDREKHTDDSLKKIHKMVDEFDLTPTPEPTKWNSVYFGIGLSLTIFFGGIILYRCMS